MNTTTTETIIPTDLTISERHAYAFGCLQGQVVFAQIQAQFMIGTTPTQANTNALLAEIEKLKTLSEQLTRELFPQRFES